MMPVPTGNIDTAAVTPPTGRPARATSGEFDALLSRFGRAKSGNPGSHPERLAGENKDFAPRDPGKERTTRTTNVALPLAENATARALANPAAASRALLAAREPHPAAVPKLAATAGIPAPVKARAENPPSAALLQRTEKRTRPLLRDAKPQLPTLPPRTGGTAALTARDLKDAGAIAPTEGSPQRETPAHRPVPLLRTRLAELPAMGAQTTMARPLVQKVSDARSAADVRPTATSSQTTLRASFLGGKLEPSADRDPRTARRATPQTPSPARASAPQADMRLTAGASRGGGAAEGELTGPRQLGEVTVTRREVHLPPARRPANIEAHLWQRQLAPDPTTSGRLETATKPLFHAVAEQLTRTLEPMRAEAESKLQQATQNALASARAYAPPVRIVELQLQPASLGALAVTMRLSGSGLRILVSATNRETADMLREDRDALASLIEGAGYDASEIIVTHRPVKWAGAR